MEAQGSGVARHSSARCVPNVTEYVPIEERPTRILYSPQPLMFEHSAQKAQGLFGVRVRIWLMSDSVCSMG